MKKPNYLKYFLSLFLLLIFGVVSFAQQNTINGKVTGDDQAPLPGVTVLIKGTPVGTITDADGNYSIQADEEDILVISFVGYLTQEIKIGTQTTINITLEVDLVGIEEVVVVGYGTVKKSDITGSLASIGSEEIKAMPIQNVNQALQGRAAGVDIFNTTFSPGEAPKIRIRGNRSIKGENDPLYVLDGIPVEGGINEVNPMDIESIEVLKDASAAAIYGSRAANGVILITTRRGEAGKVSVNYEGSISFESPLVTIDLMDGGQWAEMRRSSLRTFNNDGKYNEDDSEYPYPYADPVADYDAFGDYMNEQVWESVKMGYEWEDEENFVPKMRALDPANPKDKILIDDYGLVEIPVYDPSKVRTYDWESEALRVAKTHNHQFSVSGGTEDLRVLMSVGYVDQEGVEIGQRYQRISPRLNIDYQALKWFKMGMSSAYSFALRDPGPGLYGACAGQIPLSLPYDTAGEFNPFPADDDLIKNPLRDDEFITYEQRTNRYLGSYYAEIKFFDGFKYRINFGTDFKHYRNGEFVEPESSRLQKLITAEYYQDQNSSWTVENLLFFNKEIGIHNFGVTLLQSAGARRFERSEIKAQNFAFTSQKWYNIDNNLDATLTTVDSEYWRRQIMSYMGRINYGLLDRYLVTATLRYDGVSIFSKENRWDYFPSFALAWKAHEEGFLNGIEAISLLKLRVGYGTTGQSATEPYETDGSLKQTLYVFEETAAKGYAPDKLATREVGWEKTTQTNVGLDFGFLSNRVSGTFDWYNANTHDLLMDMNIPDVTGYTTIRANVGEVNNTGIELTLNTVNINTSGGFKWETGFIFTRNEEEIVKLYGSGEDDIASELFIGHPIESYYAYRYEGIWQVEDSALMNDLSGNYVLEPGKIRIADINDDDTLNNFDREVIGSNVPKFTGGFTTQLSYKGFELSTFVYFRVGQGIYNRAIVPPLDGRYMAWDVFYYDPLDPNRANATHQKPQDGTIDFQEGLWYKESSFAKVRHITLSYTFPKSIISKAQINSLSLYVMATNPFLFTDYDYMDPEAQGGFYSKRDVMERGRGRMNAIDPIQKIGGISTKGFVFGAKIGL
ncbi:SusC/RagA family TonB-linked outer membrane protein [Bacteroidota bacterium]